jgi:hypothetical protein
MEVMNTKLQTSDKLFIIQLLDQGSEFLYCTIIYRIQRMIQCNV